MSSARECDACGHAESRHRGNGACIEIVETSETEVALCQCNDYVPSRSTARSTLRNVGERGRAHERRMRRLRPLILDRDRRCVAAIPTVCTEHPSRVHHLWPSEKGGPDVEENLVGVCAECHEWIHNIDPAEARNLGLLRDRL